MIVVVIWLSFQQNLVECLCELFDALISLIMFLIRVLLVGFNGGSKPGFPFEGDVIGKWDNVFFKIIVLLDV